MTYIHTYTYIFIKKYTHRNISIYMHENISYLHVTQSAGVVEYTN